MDNYKHITFKDHKREVTISVDHSSGVVTIVENLDDEGQSIITTSLLELTTALFYMSTSAKLSGHVI